MPERAPLLNKVCARRLSDDVTLFRVIGALLARQVTVTDCILRLPSIWQLHPVLGVKPFALGHTRGKMRIHAQTAASRVFGMYACHTLVIARSRRKVGHFQ